MSAADELNKMIDGVEDFYNAVKEMGGTVPENKNYANMQAAAMSVPSEGPAPEPDPGEYGVLYYIDGITEAALPLQTVADFNALGDSNNASGSITISGKTIFKSNIVGYVFGSAQVELPTYFLAYCLNLKRLSGLEKTQITKIPDRFLSGDRQFNQVITFPRTVTSIGNNFLDSCILFNQPLTITGTITSIGTDFLATCSSFNQPLAIPDSVTSIGNYFMLRCSSFNSPLALPSTLRTISDSFLSECTSFNQPLVLPETVTTINNYFLNGCESFDQSFVFPSSLAYITNYFFYGLTSFSQPLTLPDGLSYSGNSFMFRCDNFTGPLNVGTSKYTGASGPSNVLSTDHASTPMCTTGVTITGENASLWISKLPDRTSSPYRKLILG